MAFLLAPRVAPMPTYAYTPCQSFACAPSPQRMIYRQPRPSFPSLANLAALLDLNLDNAIHAQRRAAHQARQQRKRALRATFRVQERESEGGLEGWEVRAAVPGFTQTDIAIEVLGERTLRITGDTERTAAAESKAATASTAESTATAQEGSEAGEEDGIAITQADLQDHEKAELHNEEGEQGRPATPASQNTYQATVEDEHDDDDDDDFEDLGAETSTSSTVSESTHSEPSSAKGKEKAAENTTAAVEHPTPLEVPTEQKQQEEDGEGQERPHAAFSQTFTFPDRIDAANVRASLKDEGLVITVPRAPVHQVRRVEIS